MHGIRDPQLTLISDVNETGQPRITITDNGQGISDEAAGKIFLPSYSTRPQSSGIGLSLSRQIMMAHGGKLELNQQSKKGASFVLTFQDNNQA